MLKKIFLIVVVNMGLSVHHSYSQCLLVDTAKLNTAYRELEKNPASNKLQKDFFDAFPSTWMEFVMTYQYIHDDLTMHFLAEEHISMLVSLLPRVGVQDSVICDKLISLSIGGKWDADAPNSLKSKIREVMSFRMELMFERISKQSRGFQLRFWQFYWSSLLANKTYKAECDELTRKMQLKYPKEVKIMKIALEYAWQEMDSPYEDFPH
jgi:hypothetical protein